MSARQFDDKFVNEKQVEIPANIAEIENKYKRTNDIFKAKEVRPPTRMERKYTRMFGAAGNTSYLFA